MACGLEAHWQYETASKKQTRGNYSFTNVTKTSENHSALGSRKSQQYQNAFSL